uniref:SFRICE_033666 n=1 Tax=Spodoptera frugiperda TaxID=7108 RepID=A0A2H1VI07_SPOFR
MHYLVPNYIGPSHINHTDIVNRNLSISNAVFGNEQNRPAIAIFDGTYAYLQKSSNYLFQKKTYSLHKYDNCFVGFRDAIPLLQRLGYQIHKPESLDHGQTQLNTEQANKSRKVTLCRWVVEVVNGRFKRDFKLFRQRFFNFATPHLMEDFKIAAAWINKYHIPIEDSPNSDEIIQRVVRFMDQPNSLGIFVRENNLNRQRSMSLRVDGNLPQLEHFPILDYSQLILMALGPYQVKRARSYYGEHIRANGIYNIEVCPDLERAKSRHIGQKRYYVYILYETEPTINHLDDILSYYCSCIVGNRTLGCCCHVMTVIWYLGWAKHQNTLSSPASINKIY